LNLNKRTVFLGSKAEHGSDSHFSWIFFVAQTLLHSLGNAVCQVKTCALMDQDESEPHKNRTQRMHCSENWNQLQNKELSSSEGSLRLTEKVLRFCIEYLSIQPTIVIFVCGDRILFSGTVHGFIGKSSYDKLGIL